MTRFLLLVPFVFACYSISSQSFVYPESKTVMQSDTFFGQVIQDPYRWLEDQQSVETTEWVKQQNEFTRDYLNKIPNHFTLSEQIKKNSFVSYFNPEKHGDYYFELRTMFGGKNMVVYYTKDIKIAYWEELFITKDLGVKKDQTIDIKGYSLSRNSKYMAYCFNSNESDWMELKVADLEKQKSLKDHLYNIKLSGIEWRGDGFYYQRFEKEENANQYTQAAKSPKLYYHRLGTLQEQDSLIFKRTDAPYNFFPVTVSKDERYLIIEDCNENTNMRSYYYFDFKDSTQKGLLPLIKKTGKAYHLLASKNDELTFFVKSQTENKIISLNVKTPLKHKEIHRLSSELILNDALYYKDFFYEICYYNQQQYLVIINEKDEIIKKVEIPFGAACSFIGVDPKNNELLFDYASFLHPPVLAAMNLTNRQFEIIEPVKINYSMDDFVVEKVMYKSDTAMVPMLLMHKKNIKPDGNNPVLIEFYGGYGTVYEPAYNSGKISFVENGGIYAYAMIRGGGEKGNYWYKDGKLFNRQHSINDIVNASKFFVDKGYLIPSKIAITGASHGGLMAAAAAIQRPDMFGAVVSVVGVYDMLRFENFTVGSIHNDEHGTVKDSLTFLNLRAFSPLHNIKKDVKYPAMLVMTSDYDDRVPPLHSYKFVATLQSLASKENPVLLRVEKNAGHYGARTYNTYMNESADFYSFILNALGVKKYK